MFSSIKRGWREARAGVNKPLVDDILNRYSRLGGYERYVLTSAFEYTKNDMESKEGNILILSNERKKDIATQLMKAAKIGYRSEPHGADGYYLLGLYLECQTIPGELAKKICHDIEAWQKEAVEKDINKLDV